MADMSQSNIPKLDGNDFANWKFRILSVLEVKALAHFLVQDSPKDEAEKAKWIQQDAQAKGIITCAMNDSQVALILTYYTFKEIWTSLQKGYEEQKKMLENARILGAEIDEEEFTTALIIRLPSKYNIIAMHIDSMDNSTIDNIRRLFELYQERYCNQEKDEQCSAYKTSQPGPSGYKTNTPNKYQKATIFKEEKASEFAKLVKERKNLEQLWILDSGASSHMTSHFEYLEEPQDNKRKIILADNSYIKSQFSGNVKLRDNDNEPFILKDVLHVPDLNENILSVSKIVEDNKNIIFDIQGSYIVDEQERKACRICDPNDFPITESRYVKFLEDKKGAALLNNDNTTKTQDYSLIEIFGNDNSEETFPLQEPEDVAESQEENLISLNQTSPRYNLRPNVRDQIYYELSSDEEPIFENEDKDPTYEPDEEAFKVSHGDLLPSSYEEAISNPDSTLWRQAMNKKIHSLKDHHVWNLIELPQGAKPIKSKWVFSKKIDPLTNKEILKARLVALGCSQKYGTDHNETFSPVMKTDYFRTLLAYATMMDYEFHNFDVETVFLYGKLTETIYITQPERYQRQGKDIIEKRERAKIEVQTDQSNDTTEPSVPKQETTFEEEETSPPQGTSTDLLTQIAEALSKLLVARSSREIDVSPYDCTFESQSFFDNFDAQADRAELTYTDRLRKLPCYLHGKPLQYFRSLRLERLFYNEARQTPIDLFPATTEASFARFLAIELTPQMPLEDYYRQKNGNGHETKPTRRHINRVSDRRTPRCRPAINRNCATKHH
ncbi:hypothetical protein LAZ67_10001254 [Cordylochernes scorpioides]|uniref:Reverse transcriptase Ty1/copia-type domain-containing protein n=1 Tax=Cordylochernes scorpioides TaxID=51811 RepID=A0ABY6KXE5_9ARAC|nr:hypothetical protein LAZ67_10001254 [Cordylochernes scorpioides]